MSKTTDCTPPPCDAFTVIKQVFLALITGGLNLIWLLARKLPGIWDRVYLTRADWITKGRNPNEWNWLGRGWLAVLATVVVTLPAAMILSSLGNLLFRPRITFPDHHIPVSSLVMILILMGAVTSMIGLVFIWLGHTVQMASTWIWVCLKSFFAPRNA